MPSLRRFVTLARISTAAAAVALVASLGFGTSGAQWDGVPSAGAQWDGVGITGAQWDGVAPNGAQWD